MESEDENMELENEAPFLTKISKENSFATPEGYFKNLTDEILMQTKLEKLAQNKTGFDVPNAYFENLKQQIQSAAKIAVVDEAPSQGFDVPDAYFAQAKLEIQKQTSTKPTSTKWRRIHFIRYAAAACILFTTSMGIYFNIKHNTSVAYQLSKVSATEIETYLSQHTDGNDLPLLIESIDDEASLDLNDFTFDEMD